MIARVGTQAIRAGEYDQAYAQYKQAQERQIGQKIPAGQLPDFQRMVLEQLIRQRLLRLEAKRQRVVVADSEAHRFLQAQATFRPGGRFDPARWAAFASDPARLASATAEAKEILAAEKLFRRVDTRFDPSPAQVDRALGAMTERAHLRILAPRSDWFGMGQAPHPDSIRARYRALTAGDTETPRVQLSLAVVPFPETAGGPDTSPRAVTATRARADSLLREIGRGASFDDVAARWGGVRDAGLWERGQTTGAFYEDRELGEEALRPGGRRVLSRPLRVPAGFAVVRVDPAGTRRGPALAQLADSLVRMQARADAARRAGGAFEARRVQRPQDFRSVCVTWRGAQVDPAKLRDPKPSNSDLQGYYERNKAQFARLDPQGTGLVYPPLSEVREVVRQRWIEEQRSRAGQEAAGRIARAWQSGKRDDDAEKAARVWEVTSSVGSVLPAGVGAALIDSVFSSAPGEVGTYQDPSGAFVFAVTRRDTTCEASQAELERRALLEAADLDRQALETEARALFDKNPSRYRGGATYHMTYVVIDPRSWAVDDVPENLIRRYYQEHPEEFGQVAETRVRHVLFVVPPQADTAAAYRKAMDALARARAGTPFDSLARAVSEDPATRQQGGDTGWFRKGMTSPEFEAVAFALEPGEIGGPVRTKFGYHVLQSVEKKEERINDYALVAGAAGKAVARVIADSLSFQVADSLNKRLRTGRQLRSFAQSRGYLLRHEVWSAGQGAMGELSRTPEARAHIAKVRKAGPLGLVIPLASTAFAVVYVDSIGPPRAGSWEESRDQAMQDALVARRERGLREALAAVQRELAAGASWDSAAAPWGGGVEIAHRNGEPIPALGNPRAVDSLLYGAPAARLGEGKTVLLTGDNGPVLVHLARREVSGPAPSAADRSAIADMMRERAGFDYFESLKKRFPVRILRASLNRPMAAPPSP